ATVPDSEPSKPRDARWGVVRGLSPVSRISRASAGQDDGRQMVSLGDLDGATVEWWVWFATHAHIWLRVLGLPQGEVVLDFGSSTYVELPSRMDSFRIRPVASDGTTKPGTPRARAEAGGAAARLWRVQSVQGTFCISGEPSCWVARDDDRLWVKQFDLA